MGCAGVLADVSFLFRTVPLIAYFFGWPHGAVWGNIAAEPLIAAGTLAVLWPFRHGLMARFVAFHHHHKILHAKKLADEDTEVARNSERSASQD